MGFFFLYSGPGIYIYIFKIIPLSAETFPVVMKRMTASRRPSGHSWKASRRYIMLISSLRYTPMLLILKFHAKSVQYAKRNGQVIQGPRGSPENTGSDLTAVQ